MEDQKNRILFITLSPIERLDKILHIIYVEGGKEKEPITKSSIASSKLFIYGFTQTPISQVESIVDKLLKDGYIKEVPKHMDYPGYLITFEGEVLIQEGGYKAKMEASEVQIKQVRNSYWVTVSIALSTGISALYYSLQLYDGIPTSHKYVALSVIPICLLCIGILRAIERIKKSK